MKRTYEIKPRSADLGGWKLTLLEDGQEAGGGVFPIPKEDPLATATWWGELGIELRTHWLMMADSTTPEAARRAYLVTEAYNDAFDAGEAWLT